jgi:hypothetical protein
MQQWKGRLGQAPIGWTHFTTPLNSQYPALAHASKVPPRALHVDRLLDACWFRSQMLTFDSFKADARKPGRKVTSNRVYLSVHFL